MSRRRFAVVRSDKLYGTRIVIQDFGTGFSDVMTWADGPGSGCPGTEGLWDEVVRAD